MGEVQEILAAIARLRPAEKLRLFALLADQGELSNQITAPSPEKRALSNTASQLDGPPDYVIIFDGGSKGNPGLGYGSYTINRVQDGARRLERLTFGDGYTSNEAEYDTLIAALRDLISRIEAAGREPREFALEVRGDSALVINQLRGDWKAKEPRMKERRDQCFRLLRRFGTVGLKTHPREQSVRILGH